MINDMAFSCFAQACEGDFTVGKDKLNKVAEILAYDWVYKHIYPNDPIVYKMVCRQVGFDYDTLLNEEVDYLAMKVEEEIRAYGGC